MSNKLKRVLAAILAVAMMLSLAACQKPSDDETTKAPANQTQGGEENTQGGEQTTEEKELDPVTLKLWLPTDKTEDSDLVLNAMNEHLKEVLPNTTLEIEWVAMSEYKDRWGKAMASREVIDLSWFGYANNKLETEIANGSVIPIDDLLAQYGSGIVETLGETAVEAHRSSDGNLYFVPSWQGLLGNRYALYVPHDTVELMGEGWAEKFQAALYENWETPFWDVESKKVFETYVEELLAKAKAENMLNLGFYIRMNPVKLWYLSNSQHSNANEVGTSISLSVYLDGDTYYVQADSAMNSPEYQQTRVFHDWYVKGYIREDVLSAKLGNVTWKPSLTRDQTYLSYFHNGWQDSEADSYSVKAGFQIDGFFFQESPEVATGFSTGAVIPSTSANPERAMMLLELIYTDAELYQMLVYGIEGTHYTKNTDGTITNAENSKYTGPNNWILGTCMNSYQTDISVINKYPDMKVAEEEARTSILQGFTFNPDPVSVEVSNVTAVVKEYSVQSMIVQDDWEAAYTARRDKMIAAGIEAVLEEYCRQLTEYAAAKGLKVVNMGY